MKFRLSVVASVLAMGLSPAWAASSASVSIHDVSFRLIDLAPDDGMTPTLSFIDGKNQTRISGWVDDVTRTEPGITRTSESGSGWFAPLLGSAASASAGATASWQANAPGMSLSAAAIGERSSYTWNMATGSASGDFLSRNITLSAHSYLVIEAAYSLRSSASDALPCLAGELCPSFPTLEFAGASAGMSLSYSYLDDGLSVSYSKSLSERVFSVARPAIQEGAVFFQSGRLWFQEFDQPGTDEFFQKEGVWTLTFVNASSVEQTANLRIGMSVWGEGNTPAIPEPSTTALYAMGVLALLGAARSRRSGASAG